MTEFTKLTSKRLFKKIAQFTDIHWGKRGNSAIHNQDNLDFIDFFCGEVKKDPDISHIFFLGDWYENRNAVNVSTLNYSHEGLKRLNALGIEIYFCVGNHDLYHRHNRDIHSGAGFDAYENVTLIEHPAVLNETFLLCPYIFGSEYGSLLKYTHLKYFAGHFEFKSFVMTGHSVLEHGPDHKNFKGPTYIFSGHFHKRQVQDNVIYIGNVFPTDMGDAGDAERGMCILDTRDDDVSFMNWDDAPTFLRTTLTEILEGNFAPPPKCRVKCLLDVDLTYSEVQSVKEGMLNDFKLREFSLQENVEERKAAIAEGGADADLDDLQLSSIDEMVASLIGTMNDTTNIAKTKLLDIYRSL